MPSNMYSGLWSVLRMWTPRALTSWRGSSGTPSRSSARSCNLHWPAVLLNTTLSATEGYRNLWSRSVSEEIISSYHAEYLGPTSGCTHHSFLHEQHLITMSSWAQCCLHWRLDWHQQAVPSRQCPLQHNCSLLSRGIRDYCQSSWLGDEQQILQHPPGWFLSEQICSSNRVFPGSPILTSCWQILFLPHGPWLGVAATPPSTLFTIRTYRSTPQ